MKTCEGVLSGFDYEVGLTGTEVNHNFDTIDFTNTYTSRPELIVSIASYNGGDASGLRRRRLGSRSVQLKVEEDTTLEPEREHVNEQVSYFAIGGTGFLNGSAVF